MHDGRQGKLIADTASLKFAATSRQYVLNPFAALSVGDCNQESVWRSKHIHWRSVASARLPTYMREDAEARQSVGESARDPVGDSQVEGCYPPFAESDQDDRSRKHC